MVGRNRRGRLALTLAFRAKLASPDAASHYREFGTQVALVRALATDEPKQENKIPGHKEHHNDGKDECKAGNQDRDPDSINGRYFCGSERSNPSRRRRRPTHSVPTQTAELPDYSDANVSQAK